MRSLYARRRRSLRSLAVRETRSPSNCGHMKSINKGYTKNQGNAWVRTCCFCCVCSHHPGMHRQSLRQIGGRSPGSQDSRRPRHTPVPKHVFTVEPGSTKKSIMQRTCHCITRAHQQPVNALHPNEQRQHRAHHDHVQELELPRHLVVEELNLRHLHGLRSRGGSHWE